jgi:hypothetical protein
MRRRVRNVPLTRFSSSRELRDLKFRPPDSWPQYVRIAHEIISKEIKLSIPASRNLILDAVSAGYICSCKINERVTKNERSHLSMKVRNAYARVAKCIQRAPAKLRNELDQKTRCIVSCDVIDLEVIEEILDITVAHFEQFPKHEAAKAALKVMLGRSTDDKPTNALKTDYSGLDFDSQRLCEKALSTLAAAPGEAVSAFAVFEALASALGESPMADVREEAADLIIEYVTAVAALWRRAGLHPSRAWHPEDPRYTSRFHRFVELVLTASIDPWTQRHDLGLDDLRRRTRKAHAALPESVRRAVSAAPRRSDLEWLVSDDHVKKALQARFQKSGRDTP